MDLSTTYLGLSLRSPLVPSASPLSEDVDQIKRMEDAGAGAVVLHSLFEEQLRRDRHELHQHLTSGTDSYAEALSYFPAPQEFRSGPEGYLEEIRRAKEAVSIPIIASLNGSTPGNWVRFAREIQQAGADALELNLYELPTDPAVSGALVEQQELRIVASVRREVSIPLAVKLSPYYSSLANMAQEVCAAGADGLVLFNRFYQPDLNLETLEVEPQVVLSTAADLRLPLRWIAILYGRVSADLAATSGVHTGHDALKLLMVGARVAMLASVLLKRGIGALGRIEAEMREWMESHGYESVRQLQGCLSQQHCPNPAAFERAQYMRVLRSYPTRASEPHEGGH